MTLYEPQTRGVLEEVLAERYRQEEKHGDKSGVGRHLPLGTYGPYGRAIAMAEAAKKQTDKAFAIGRGTWWHILYEEVCETFAESEPEKVRAELIQVAAVAVAAIEDIDLQLAADFVRPHGYTYDGLGPVECTFTELNGVKCGLPEDGHGDGRDE